MARHVLILDTPKGALKGLTRAVRAAARADAEFEEFDAAADLLARIDSGLPCDLVLLDYLLGDGTRKGPAILRAIRERDAAVPVVAVAEQGDVESAARAIQAGATDFLVRGGRLKKRVSTLLAKVRALLDLREQNRVLGEQNRLLREALAHEQIVGESPQMLQVIRCVDRVAAIPRPVLITGERGTGKELVARAIHEASGHADGPFVAVNCAAFTDNLLESELFGHEKGAYTGADSMRAGRFEQATGGTLFLDEIGNMSLAFQKKILRVVEYGVFNRVGGRAEVRSDARIIAATNSDLKAKMRSGEFLRDLYDRLSFEVIQVPPLRDRAGDVEVLARHFLDAFMREIPALGGKRLARSALDALARYPFPGNVRELKNIVERAAYRDTTNEITPEDLGLLPDATLEDLPPGTFKQRVAALERRLIGQALEQAGGNQARAARRLGLTYHQFRYCLKKYGAGRD